MAPNNSSTGGYLTPTSTQGLPGGLTLNQFIQTVLVGISAIPGDLVRPRWQIQPPKQPDLSVDWMAFGIVRHKRDTYAYSDLDADDNNNLIRQELLEVQCSFYGPNSLDVGSQVLDGFQIQQNLEALRSANMGFKEMSEMVHLPELVNERYIDRYEATLFLVRQIQRVYAILPIVAANGTIHTVLGNEEYLLNWDVPEEV